jgi:hypothetical protein
MTFEEILNSGLFDARSALGLFAHTDFACLLSAPYRTEYAKMRKGYLEMAAWLKEVTEGYRYLDRCYDETDEDVLRDLPGTMLYETLNLGLSWRPHQKRMMAAISYNIAEIGMTSVGLAPDDVVAAEMFLSVKQTMLTIDINFKCFDGGYEIIAAQTIRFRTGNGKRLN